MANPFETVVVNMRELGFFQFLLPFMLSSAIFYGLLRKSKIFGDPTNSVSINAVIAIVASFMIWASPIILGIDIETSLASFFVYGASLMLITMVGLMIVGMLVPGDLPEHFKTVFKNNPKVWMAILALGIIAGVVAAVLSGLISIDFFDFGSGSNGGSSSSGFAISEDVIMMIAMVLIMVIPLIIIVALG